MNLLRSIIIAFSCFSSIPLPMVDWTPKNMRYMMAAFPLVGVVVGVGSYMWWHVCDALGFGVFARSVGLALLPLAITGGIHMDGFADVVDAQSSHTDPKRKRQILKDPHTGAFAIMGIASYLLSYAALASELDARFLVLYSCTPVLSRCVSASMAVSWQGSSQSGMFATVSSTAHKPAVCIALCIEGAAAAIIALHCNLVVGISALAVLLMLLAWLKRFSVREFGGMSGDLLGFFVQVAELAMLAVVVFAGRLV